MNLKLTLEKRMRNTFGLALLLSPFIYGAVAINVFMLGLVLAAAEWSSLSPSESLILALPLSVPCLWVATRWVQHLLRLAEN